MRILRLATKGRTLANGWLLFALLVAATPAAAQLAFPMPDTTIHVLDIPSLGQPLLCHQDPDLPDSVRKLHVSSWEFDIGTPIQGPIAVRPRTVMVQFDSAGASRVLMDMVTLEPVRSDQVLLILLPGSHVKGRWSTTRFDSASLDRMRDALFSRTPGALAAAIPPPQTRDMTPEEEQRARVLTRWLWEHRCAGP